MYLSLLLHHCWRVIDEEIIVPLLIVCTAMKFMIKILFFDDNKRHSSQISTTKDTFLGKLKKRQKFLLLI